MRFEPNRPMTKDLQEKVARVALRHMKRECESDFEVLAGFRTHTTERFLGWIRTIPKPQRLEAALSLTCRNLKRRRIACEMVPNFEYWASLFGGTPVDLGLDRTWQPRRYAKRIRMLVREMPEWRAGGQQSFDLSEDSLLSISDIRTGLELNTRVADVVLLQFFRGDNSLFDLSYVSLLGIGPTGWKINDDIECEKVIKQLPLIIGKAKELF
jgi:hypothetical protein